MEQNNSSESNSPTPKNNIDQDTSSSHLNKIGNIITKKGIAIGLIATTAITAAIFFNKGNSNETVNDQPTTDQQEVILPDNNIDQDVINSESKNENPKVDKKISDNEKYLNFKSNGKDPKDPAYVITYTDPGTGQTITEVPNKMAETNGRVNNVIISGEKKIIDLGIEEPQLKELRADYNEFANLQETPIKVISIDLASLNHVDIDQNTGVITMKYKIYLDRSKDDFMFSKTIASGMKNIQLEITDQNGKVVYNSANN